MSVALDTNILTRAAQPAHPSHNQTLDALAVLQKRGEDLCIVPQNLYEFARFAVCLLEQQGFGKV